MGLLTFAGRIVLVVVNIVFILVSLTLIIAGFIIRFAHEWLKPRLDSVLNKIESTVQEGYGDAEFSTDKFEFGSLVSTLCYIMIAAGVVLLAISFLGCCGACCSFTTVMLVYSIILIVILLAQVAAIILVFAKPDVVKDRMKSTLQDTMKDYDGIKGTSVSALGWNWVQQEFDCCGAEGYADFGDKGSPYKDSGVNDNADMGGNTGNVGAPVACCKTLPTDDGKRTTCAGNGAPPTEANSNLNKGCVNEVWSRVVEENTLMFGIVVGICFLIQIVLIIFACLVFKNRGVTGGLI
ncbi:CD63 antigen-like [Ruditapes philippinarum]|uniref:CD63 antigen-like n=1 Tax=Ruditapes philippinarum TaxID=129788 RepID=UPI00295A79BD|nr:CD63 antigen-like [Ruditapes philippinarum]XP_060557628.1 CD63 antigen-like [Ruditapes philippinarum]XP_060557629.1 CD63 antigen-like [Ruditapes philippinarum]